MPLVVNLSAQNSAETTVIKKSMNPAEPTPELHTGTIVCNCYLRHFAMAVLRFLSELLWCWSIRPAERGSLEPCRLHQRFSQELRAR